jgi:HD-GYP domain-containing protein (c-di-GMP phosphodiesterase class II)
MTSDRPYRKGMPLEKVHRILRDGVGRHWDRRVVDAYFRVEDDISRLAREERVGVMLDVQEWS